MQCDACECGNGHRRAIPPRRAHVRAATAAPSISRKLLRHTSLQICIGRHVPPQGQGTPRTASFVARLRGGAVWASSAREVAEFILKLRICASTACCKECGQHTLRHAMKQINGANAHDRCWRDSTAVVAHSPARLLVTARLAVSRFASMLLWAPRKRSGALSKAVPLDRLT